MDSGACGVVSRVLKQWFEGFVGHCGWWNVGKETNWFSEFLNFQNFRQISMIFQDELGSHGRLKSVFCICYCIFLRTTVTRSGWNIFRRALKNVPDTIRTIYYVFPGMDFHIFIFFFGNQPVSQWRGFLEDFENFNWNSIF